MSCHLSDQQLQSFWAAKAAQADVAHIRDCNLCRARLAELACDEQEVVHIGHLYLMLERCTTGSERRYFKNRLYFDYFMV